MPPTPVEDTLGGEPSLSPANSHPVRSPRTTLPAPWWLPDPCLFVERVAALCVHLSPSSASPFPSSVALGQLSRPPESWKQTLLEELRKGEPETLDRGIVSLSPTWGVEIT